jgi:DNA-binding phage protein
LEAVQEREEGGNMIAIRPLSVSIQEDLQDPLFRRTFLGEALEAIISGDIEHGKVVLREYINGTLGFVKLGAALGKSPKSLMRMLSHTGNPNLRTFANMLAYLQKVDSMVLTVKGIAAENQPKAA